jgi:hypothetical protein
MIDQTWTIGFAKRNGQATVSDGLAIVKQKLSNSQLPDDRPTGLCVRSGD